MAEDDIKLSHLKELMDYTASVKKSAGKSKSALVYDDENDQTEELERKLYNARYELSTPDFERLQSGFGVYSDEQEGDVQSQEEEEQKVTESELSSSEEEFQRFLEEEKAKNEVQNPGFNAMDISATIDDSDVAEFIADEESKVQISSEEEEDEETDEEMAKLLSSGNDDTSPDEKEEVEFDQEKFLSDLEDDEKDSDQFSFTSLPENQAPSRASQLSRISGASEVEMKRNSEEEELLILKKLEQEGKKKKKRKKKKKKKTEKNLKEEVAKQKFRPVSEAEKVERKRASSQKKVVFEDEFIVKIVEEAHATPYPPSLHEGEEEIVPEDIVSVQRYSVDTSRIEEYESDIYERSDKGMTDVNYDDFFSIEAASDSSGGSYDVHKFRFAQQDNGKYSLIRVQSSTGTEVIDNHNKIGFISQDKLSKIYNEDTEDIIDGEISDNGVRVDDQSVDDQRDDDDVSEKSMKRNQIVNDVQELLVECMETVFNQVDFKDNHKGDEDDPTAKSDTQEEKEVDGLNKGNEREASQTQEELKQERKHSSRCEPPRSAGSTQRQNSNELKQERSKKKKKQNKKSKRKSKKTENILEEEDDPDPFNFFLDDDDVDATRNSNISCGSQSAGEGTSEDESEVSEVTETSDDMKENQNLKLEGGEESRDLDRLSREEENIESENSTEMQGSARVDGSTYGEEFLGSIEQFGRSAGSGRLAASGRSGMSGRLEKSITSGRLSTWRRPDSVKSEGRSIRSAKIAESEGSARLDLPFHLEVSRNSDVHSRASSIPESYKGAKDVSPRLRNTVKRTHRVRQHTYQRMRKKSKKVLSRKERYEAYKRLHPDYCDEVKDESDMESPDEEIPSIRAKVVGEKVKEESVGEVIDAILFLLNVEIEVSEAFVHEKTKMSIINDTMNDLICATYREAVRREEYRKDRGRMECIDKVINGVLDKCMEEIEKRENAEYEAALEELSSDVVHCVLSVSLHIVLEEDIKCASFVRNAIGNALLENGHEMKEVLVLLWKVFNIYEPLKQPASASKVRKHFFTWKERANIYAARQKQIQDYEKILSSRVDANTHTPLLKQIGNKMTYGLKNSDADAVSDKEKTTPDIVVNENLTLDSHFDSNIEKATSDVNETDLKAFSLGSISMSEYEEHPYVTKEYKARKLQKGRTVPKNLTQETLKTLPEAQKGEYVRLWLVKNKSVPLPPIEPKPKGRDLLAGRKRRFRHKRPETALSEKSDANIYPIDTEWLNFQVSRLQPNRMNRPESSIYTGRESRGSESVFSEMKDTSSSKQSESVHEEEVQSSSDNAEIFQDDFFQVEDEKPTKEIPYKAPELLELGFNKMVVKTPVPQIRFEDDFDKEVESSEKEPTVKEEDPPQTEEVNPRQNYIYERQKSLLFKETRYCRNFYISHLMSPIDITIEKDEPEPPPENENDIDHASSDWGVFSDKNDGQSTISAGNLSDWDDDHQSDSMQSEETKSVSTKSEELKSVSRKSDEMEQTSGEKQEIPEEDSVTKEENNNPSAIETKDTDEKKSSARAKSPGAVKPADGNIKQFTRPARPGYQPMYPRKGVAGDREKQEKPTRLPKRNTVQNIANVEKNDRAKVSTPNKRFVKASWPDSTGEPGKAATQRGNGKTSRQGEEKKATEEDVVDASQEDTVPDEEQGRKSSNENTESTGLRYSNKWVWRRAKNIISWRNMQAGMNKEARKDYNSKAYVSVNQSIFNDLSLKKAQPPRMVHSSEGLVNARGNAGNTRFPQLQTKKDEANKNTMHPLVKSDSNKSLGEGNKKKTSLAAENIDRLTKGLPTQRTVRRQPLAVGAVADKNTRGPKGSREGPSSQYIKEKELLLPKIYGPSRNVIAAKGEARTLPRRPVPWQ